MKTPNLIDVPKLGLTRRGKVQEFKKTHGIWTFHSTHMRREDEPWSALRVPEGVAGREMEHIAEYGLRLECSGELVTARTEKEAIRELCYLNGIPCPL